jgi:hypothetical protein
MSGPPNMLKRLLLQGRAILSTKLLINNPYVPDIFFPYKADDTSFLLLKSEDRGGGVPDFPSLLTISGAISLTEKRPSFF